MKKILFILSFLIASFAAMSQCCIYLRAKDSIIMMHEGGTVELVIRNKTKDTVGGVLTNIGNGITEFRSITGGGGSVVGKEGDIFFKRAGIQAANDSLNWNNAYLTLRGGANIGSFSGTNHATVQITQNGNTPSLFIAPYNYLSTLSVNAPNVYINVVDSNINVASNLKGGGVLMGRTTYFNNGNKNLTFKHGVDIGWGWNLADSLNPDPQNLDGINGTNISMSYSKQFSGRSVVLTNSDVDPISSLMVQTTFGNTGTGSNIYANALASLSAYLIDNNGFIGDTIKYYYSLIAGAAANLTPHVLHWCDLCVGSAGAAGSSRVDSMVGIHSYSGINGLVTRNIFEGPTVFGTGHTGPTHNVEIIGSLEFIDGNQCAGCILMSDGSGVARWQDTTGLFGGGGGGGGGMNTAASNAASVAVNVAWLPGADNSIALGSSSKQWTNVFTGSGGGVKWSDASITHTAASTIFMQPADGGIQIGKAGTDGYVQIFSNGFGDGITLLTNPIEIRTVSGSNSLIIGTSGDKIGIGATPDASAKLDIISTTLGFGVPSMTTTQKNAISSPREGLLIYDTTLHKLCIRVAAAWETVTSL